MVITVYVTTYEHDFRASFWPAWLRLRVHGSNACTRMFFRTQECMHAFNHAHAHAHFSCTHNTLHTHLIHAHAHAYALAYTQYEHTYLQTHTRIHNAHIHNCSSHFCSIALSIVCLDPHDCRNGLHHRAVGDVRGTLQAGSGGQRRLENRSTCR